MAGMTFIQKAKALDYTKSVKYLLHNHLAGMEPDRGKDVVHASELTQGRGRVPARICALPRHEGEAGRALSQRPRRTSPSPWGPCCRTLSSRPLPT